METTLVTVSMTGKEDIKVNQKEGGPSGIAGIVDALTEVNKHTNEHLTAIIKENTENKKS